MTVRLFDCRYDAISPVTIGEEPFAGPHRTLRWRRVVARWKRKHAIYFCGALVVADRRAAAGEWFASDDDPRYRIDY
jgi:hypothetical protein